MIISNFWTIIALLMSDNTFPRKSYYNFTWSSIILFSLCEKESIHRSILLQLFIIRSSRVEEKKEKIYMERFSNPYRGNQRSKHCSKKRLFSDRVRGSSLNSWWIASTLNFIHGSMSQRIVIIAECVGSRGLVIEIASFFFFSPSPSLFKIFLHSSDNESFTSAITAVTLETS